MRFRERRRVLSFAGLGSHQNISIRIFNILALLSGGFGAIDLTSDGGLSMRIEMLPGMTNVVRFPVERRARPTLELLRDIAPDAREVLSIAEAFDLDIPGPDLRARVDQETAEHIVNTIVDMRMLSSALDELANPTVARAVDACRAAHDASVAAAEAQKVLLSAQISGHFRLDPLRERAEALTLRTAELLIDAHMRVEEAEGVVRAVGFARRGEKWTPRSYRADEEALFGPAIRQAG